MLEFPAYHARYGGDGGEGPAMRACDGPIAYRDTAAVRGDIAALRAAVDGAEVEEAFPSAASPGVVAFLLPTATTATTRPTSSSSPTR